MDKAYEDLREKIVTLEFPPGAAISEAGLSSQMNIGRTPIREALQRLEREYLVVILPQRGCIVSEINAFRQLRLLALQRDVRRLLARGAAKQATPRERKRFLQLAGLFLKRGNDQSDLALMRTEDELIDLCTIAARNEFAADAMRLMHPLSRRFWNFRYKQAMNLPRTAHSNAKIAQAIANADAETAAKMTDALFDTIDAFIPPTFVTDRISSVRDTI